MRKRDVRADFLDQPFPDMARGDELAVLSGERAVVDGELHLNRRRIDRHERQRRRGLRSREIVSPMNTSSKPVDADDVAGVRFLDFDPLHAFEMEDHGDLALGLAAVAVAGRLAGSPTLTLPA